MNFFKYFGLPFVLFVFGVILFTIVSHQSESKTVQEFKYEIMLDAGGYRKICKTNEYMTEEIFIVYMCDGKKISAPITSVLYISEHQQ